MDDFLEKGLLRNSKRFSAVFERIYDKYDREFENGEDGAQELDHYDMLCWEEEEEEESGKECTRQRLRPSYHLLMEVPSGSDAEEDPELTALLHRKVVQVKKEICWEEEEKRDLERTRQKAMSKRHHSNSSSEEEEPEEKANRNTGRGRRRRRKGRLCLAPVNSASDVHGCSLQNGSEKNRDVSETYRDGSETLYETEYHSESEQSCVQSDPEERGCVTPPLGRPVKRGAFSTPRVGRKRRRSSSIRRSSIRALHASKKEVTPIDKEVNPTTIQAEDELLFSGYESASECHSGPGEHPVQRSSTDSERLEYIGSPQHPLSDTCLTPDVLTSPPPILSGSFDENLPVVVQYGSRGEEGQGTEDGETVQSKEESKPVDPSKKHSPAHREGGEEGDRVLCHRCSQDERVKPASEDGALQGSQSPPPGSGDQSHDGHVTTPLVIHNTNVAYVSYHRCGHAHPLDIGRPRCPHCFPPQTCGCFHLPPLSHCHHSHPSHTHFHPTPAHPQFPHTYPYKRNPTTKYPGPFDNVLTPFDNVLAPFKDRIEDANSFSWTILPLPPPKRKLDSEVPDPLEDTELPQLKKQCIK